LSFWKKVYRVLYWLRGDYYLLDNWTPSKKKRVETTHDQ